MGKKSFHLSRTLHKLLKNKIIVILIPLIILFGLPIIMLRAMTSFPLLNKYDPLSILSIVVFVIVLLISLLVVWRKQSRNRSPKITSRLPGLITLILLLGFSLFVSVILLGLLTGFNGTLDNGKEITARYVVINKWSYYSYRFGMEYNICLTPYNPEAHACKTSLSLTADTYKKITIGTLIDLKIKPGFLHSSWISGYTILESTP